MTCRPLLWTTATAVVLGAAAWSPAPAGAQSLEWTVTIDVASEVASHTVVVSGTVTPPLAVGEASSVDVSLTPKGLPDACGTEPFRTTVAPSGRDYVAPVDVVCNGPYEISVVGRGGLTASNPETQDVGVAEPPEPPLLEDVELSTGGAVATWSAAPAPDAAGWIIRVNESVEHQYDDPASNSAELSGSFGSATFDMRALSWGAGGPGTDAIASPVSNQLIPAEGPTVTVPSTDPDPPPGTDPTLPPGPGTTPTPPGGSTPTPTTGHVPTRGQGSPETLPEGYSEELPFGTVDDAFVPGSSTTAPNTDEEQAAAGTSPSAGLVRTTEKTSPGLVAPFALALLMITIAAHIAWYLRRSKPSGGGGQVSLP
ncbi:MAG TPA: hypothetical protein VGO60_01980 [Iamia sp.]|jgi:hypothetical protein|nr:hypothetical protein [Iamia sp.]